MNIKQLPSYWMPLWKMYDDPFNKFNQIMIEKGDIVRVRTPFTFYFVNDPALISHMLETSNLYFGKKTLDNRLFNAFLAKGIVSNEGDVWEKVSNLSYPYFSSTRNEQLTLAIKQGIEVTLAAWETYAINKQQVDLGEEVARLCFRIACQILFSNQSDDYSVTDYLEHVDISTFDGIALLLKYLPSKGNREHRKFHQQFESLINKLGQQAIKSKTDCLYTKLEKSLSKKQLMREMKVFVFGSHATLSNLLTWTLYSISNNKLYQDKVEHEISKINPKHDDFSFIPKLKYTSQLINEVMRLYPPVWMMTRKCNITHQFNNYIIPKGSSFIIMPWTLHRNPKYWQEPEIFDPERFKNENSYNKKSFLPFSDGPRKCMGRRLAVMELYMITSKLLKQFRISILNTKSIYAKNCMSPKPSERIKVSIELRQDFVNNLNPGSINSHTAVV